MLQDNRAKARRLGAAIWLPNLSSKGRSGMLRKVTAVAARMPWIICTMCTGETVEYYLSDALESSGPIAIALREPSFFAKVFLDCGIPTWPNGMDFCPDHVFLAGRRTGGENA